MLVLVTGSSGYIGSHVIRQLLQHNIAYICYDIVEGLDILNNEQLEHVFSNNNVTHVIHLAALKSVVESIQHPDIYMNVNVEGTRNIINMMKKYSVNNIIFSSSATVYDKETHEDAILHANNPYGESKIRAEQIIKDSGVNYCILRYFNPIGHDIGLRETLDSPNIFPSCMRSVIKQQPLHVYGNCTRDYFYVGDLAHFHYHLLIDGFNNLVLNYGTGNGITTLEFVDMFMRYNDLTIDIVQCDNRQGDKQICVADVSKLLSLYPNIKFTPINRWFLM